MDVKEIISYLIFVVMAGLFLASCAGSPEEAEREKIEAVISSMTLEDKANLVVGTGMNLTGADGANAVALTDQLVSGAAGAQSSCTSPDMVWCASPKSMRVFSW